MLGYISQRITVVTVAALRMNLCRCEHFHCDWFLQRFFLLHVFSCFPSCLFAAHSMTKFMFLFFSVFIFLHHGALFAPCLDLIVNTIFKLAGGLVIKQICRYVFPCYMCICHFCFANRFTPLTETADWSWFLKLAQINFIRPSLHLWMHMSNRSVSQYLMYESIPEIFLCSDS